MYYVCRAVDRLLSRATCKLVVQVQVHVQVAY